MRFAQDRIRFLSYELDPSQGLRRGADAIHLTPKSLQILNVLARRAGEIVTKEELFREVWSDTIVSDSALTTCIQELRRAFGDDAREPRFIETVHRRGFRFVAELAETRAADLQVSVGAPVVVVGRDAVTEQLRAAYESASAGRRQLVFIRGEAGIGKTTVVQAFVAKVPWSTWGQCVEHYGIGEPYEPLLDALTRLVRQNGAQRVIRPFETYAPSWVAQLPGFGRAAHFTGTSRERMLRELTDAMEAITAEEALVVVIEDLHWSDASTFDWIASFAQRPEPARILIICTLRPSAVDERIDALRVKKVSREIELGGLSEAAVEEYTAELYPGDTATIAALVHRHTDGNPLFLTTVFSDLVDRGLLIERGGRWSLAVPLEALDLGVPDDLRRMIQTQFNRLSADEKELLKAASVAGASFSVATVAAAARCDEETAEATLTALADAQRFVRHALVAARPHQIAGTAFEFLHALYREVIYDSVPAGRRSKLHRVVGEAEEAAYGARAAEIAAELAMHFEQSSELDRAIAYRRHAAENARQKSALKEARTHLEKALSLLATQPSSPDRTEQEIALRIGLGGVMMTAEGWGAAEAADHYSIARELAQTLHDQPRLFPALWGLWLFYWGRGPLSVANELAQNLLALARRSNDGTQLLQAHHACWATAFSRGELDDVISHAAEGVRLYDEQAAPGLIATYGNHDAGSCARAFAARAHALKGDAGLARALCDEAVILARRIDHTFSLALSEVFAAAVEQSLGDRGAASLRAAAAETIARQQDFRLIHAWGVIYQGWAENDPERMEEGVSEARATGSHQFMEHLLALLAEVYLDSGRRDEGRRALEDAEKILLHMGSSFYEPQIRSLRSRLRARAGS